MVTWQGDTGDKEQMKITRTLVWVSRALFAMGVLLVVAVFIYSALSSGSTDAGASDGRLRVFVVLFCCIAWCLFAGASVRTLTTSTSWTRALLDIASTVGFGLFFTAIVVLITGTSSAFPTVALGIIGFAVTLVTKIVSFVAFGAKEAAEAVEQAVAQVQQSIADAREVPSSMPSPPQPEEGPKASGMGPGFLTQ